MNRFSGKERYLNNFIPRVLSLVCVQNIGGNRKMGGVYIFSRGSLQREIILKMGVED